MGGPEFIGVADDSWREGSASTCITEDMNPRVSDDLSGLIAHLETNQVIRAIIARAAELELPNWYLGAGCIPQTVWNALHGFSPTDHIRDYDITYFDASDTSYEAEDQHIRHAERLFAQLPVTIELRNQARVHCRWRERRCGRPSRFLTPRSLV